jgi:hypothetical protein
MIRSLFRHTLQTAPGPKLLWALSAAVIASIAVRYALMESDALHAVCAAAGHDWRCVLRRWLPQLFIDQRIGWLALAAGLLSILTRHIALARVAIVSGGAGLILYSADYAAAGLLLGLIRIASHRSQRDSSP